MRNRKADLGEDKKGQRGLEAGLMESCDVKICQLMGQSLKSSCETVSGGVRVGLNHPVGKGTSVKGFGDGMSEKSSAVKKIVKMHVTLITGIW